MQVALPRWAQELLDRHPNGQQPSAENPMPAWLEQELEQVPLWAYLRGVKEVRHAPPYYLIEDVHSQPALMRAVLDLRPELSALAQCILDDRIGHLVFVGCGSAFFNSLLGAFLFRHWTGLTAEGLEALEFAHYWVPVSGKAALIAQSATGGSMETLDAAHRAQAEGLLTIALTNTPDSPLEVLCDETIAFPTGQKCGPDVSVITTRLMMMYLLALEVGRRDGTLRHERAQEIELAIVALPALAEELLREQEETIAGIATAVKDQQALLVVGGGPNWYSALEGALKVEEECSMVCKAYRPAEYPHDAIALLSPEVTTVVIAPPGKSYQRLHDCVRTGQAAGSRGLAIVTASDEGVAGDADYVIRVPGEPDEMLFPPLATIVFQVLGYYLAIERGYNPDALRTDDLDHARAWLTAFPLGTH